MNQKEFTDYVIIELIKIFPQFADCYTSEPANIASIRYKSNANKLVLWVTTNDNEITIGFGDLDGFIWHTHMNLFGATNPYEELDVAIELIKAILSDTEPILFWENEGYYLVSDVEAELKEVPSAMVYKWSQL